MGEPDESLEVRRKLREAGEVEVPEPDEERIARKLAKRLRREE